MTGCLVCRLLSVCVCVCVCVCETNDRQRNHHMVAHKSARTTRRRRSCFLLVPELPLEGRVKNKQHVLSFSSQTTTEMSSTAGSFSRVALPAKR